ncbi:MAG: error-prone DNA polymerase [Pontibacterium sp.]
MTKSNGTYMAGSDKSVKPVRHDVVVPLRPNKPDAQKAATEAPKALPYAELHCLSNFSFLRGASHPHELVEQAVKLGYQALAMTDECSVAGVVRAWEAAKEQPIQLIIGAEFYLEGHCLVVLAPTRVAYGALCALISRCRRRAKKGEYEVQWADFSTGLEGCLLCYRPSLEGMDAVLQSARQLPNPLSQNIATLAQAFPQRMWLLAELMLDTDKNQMRQSYEYLSELWQLPCVAGNDVHMHHPSRQSLQDVLTAIRHNQRLDACTGALFSNAERHLRSLKKLAHIYPSDWLVQTQVIAQQCQFELSSLRYEYPPELVPKGEAPDVWLRLRVEQGIEQRYPQGVPNKVAKQIEHELAVIKQLRYEHYFLTIADIVEFARGQGILCQGRGSAANSVVCYCLHITEVDPLQVNLLFERFISPERNEPPDIDVDFEHERREEVIQYIYRRYGRKRAGLAATVIRYRAKSAIRDVGRALGMDEHYLTHLIHQLDRRDKEMPWLTQLVALGGESMSQQYALFVEHVARILDFPRHLSQHVGGFVISAGLLSELVPIENAAMADRTLIQWNKDDLESLGLLKVDVLALGMLSAIRKCLQLISHNPEQPMRLQDIPREDPAVYDRLCHADTVGVFQIESRAQMNMLPRLKPRCYYDLVIQVAIVRPGPIQGDMVHPYLRRRDGLEPVEYPSDAVREVLQPTLGVPIFQEQVIRLAMVAAGFSGGEADKLRRAMAAWKRNGALAPYQAKLVEGMLARGYSADYAERICRQIEGFGEYGFPESHAASFALLVYVSAWQKRYYPAAFCCALLNSQPMGFYSPSQLIQDAIRHGVTVLPVDINASQWQHTLEYPDNSDKPNPEASDIPRAKSPHIKPSLRLGFRLIKGLSQRAAEQLLSTRGTNAFSHINEARQRCGLASQDWEKLAAAGALQSLGLHRYQARWALLAQPMLWANGQQDDAPINEALAAPSELSSLEEDLRHTGVSLGRHPIELLREQINLSKCLHANELASARHGQLVHVVGLVTNRQRPGTASGVTFVTLEDHTGQINLVVWLNTAKAQRQALLRARVLKVSGVLEKEGEVVHVVAGKLEDLSDHWQALNVRSRDFR